MSTAEAEVSEWVLTGCQRHANLETSIDDCYADNLYMTRPNQAPIIGKSDWMARWNKSVAEMKAAGITKLPIEFKIETVHVDPTGTTACVRCNFTNTEKNVKGSNLIYCAKIDGQWKTLEESGCLYPN